MKNKNFLDGKNILIVDDEPDVLEALEELLPMCNLEKAANFEAVSYTHLTLPTN